MCNRTPSDIAEHYCALAHNEDMHLLQASAAKSGEIAAWKAGFSARISAYSHPLPNPPGVPKGNVVGFKSIKMNDIEIGVGYPSVNSAARFLPFFCRKMVIFAKKMPFLP
jgi:hypothetical protein